VATTAPERRLSAGSTGHGGAPAPTDGALSQWWALMTVSTTSTTITQTIQTHVLAFHS
jgi:hypothetical protein